MRITLQGWAAVHGYALATLAIAVSTAVFVFGRADFAKGQWALLYLLIVVIVASVSGTRPAVLAAVLAFLAWDFFFLPPYYTFVVTDVKDYLSLAAFLAVGVLMGIQTGRMREREARAVAREHETALLNSLSTRLVSQTSTETMAETVLSEIVRLLGSAQATLFVAEEGELLSLCASPPCAPPDRATAENAQQALRRGQPVGLPNLDGPSRASLWTRGSSRHDSSPDQAGVAGGGTYLPLVSPSGVTGVLAVKARSKGGAYTGAEARLLTSLANLVAVFLERQRLQAAASRAEAAREADRLKSSLLSSVSHELKTPLAALAATVSNLLESDLSWDERSVREELRAIVADVTRLNNSIGALLDLSRLEAHAWEPRCEPSDLADVVGASLDALPAHQRRRIAVDLPDNLPLLDLDLAQWVRVFRNLFENALLYAGEESSVRVGGRAQAGTVRLWVEDDGPGILPDERDAVFEKFYRARSIGAKAPSGTGLGLAITREVVQAHGGTIHVEDARPHGARFVIALPAPAPEAQRVHG